MKREQSLFEQKIENDPELKKLFEKTRKRFEKAAEKESKKREDMQLITAEDLAVIVR